MAVNFPFTSFSTIRPGPNFVVNNQIPIPNPSPNLFVHSQIPNSASCTHNSLQSFQYFVVVDFEATCDKERIPFPQEIIEFPAVIVSGATGQIKSYFQVYVRPTYNPVLTDFCKQLTGIEQIQVDDGITLSEALFLHDKWLDQMGVKSTNFAIVTWSNWDCQVILQSECNFKKIQKPDYFNSWINLRIPFRQVYGDVQCNLKQAVELAGLVWQGRVHCGLDDAINISRLFSVIIHKGYKFSITKSLDLMQTKPPQLLQPQRITPLQLLPPPCPIISYNPEDIRYCFCKARSLKKIIKKPGPKEGKFFFGCGRWTPNRGACCNYFEWAS